MSEELTKEIDHLRAENAKLSKDLSGLTDELKDTRHEARDRRHEAKTLTEQVAALTVDRDQWKTKAETSPTELQGRVQELTGKLRSVTHRQAFDRLAAANKVSDPARQADLWALTGYKPETDTVDEAKLAETIQGALKGRPWFLDASSTAAGAATTAPGGANGTAKTDAGGKPGPGNDRGQSVTSTAGQVPKKISGRL